MRCLSDSCQQLGEGVFGGDEFASEGFSPERLCEAVDVRLRLPPPGIDQLRSDRTNADSTLVLSMRRQSKSVPNNRRECYFFAALRLDALRISFSVRIFGGFSSARGGIQAVKLPLRSCV